MALIIHIIIALSSVVFAGLLLAQPSKNKFYIDYGFIVATIASGTYLIVTTGTHMLSACISGLTYLGVVTTLTVVARARFTRQNV